MNKIILFCFVVCIANVFAQSDDRRDGNYWNELPENEKYKYVTGFFDGLELGNRFSYWGMDSSKHDCLAEAIASFREYGNKYFKDVTNIQIVDGLNEFYKDYRNRKIKIIDSIWLISNSIAGMSEQEIQTMIENYRKNASY